MSTALLAVPASIAVPEGTAVQSPVLHPSEIAIGKQISLTAHHHPTASISITAKAKGWGIIAKREYPMGTPRNGKENLYAFMYTTIFLVYILTE